MTALQCPTTLVLARHGEAEYESSEWDGEGGSLTPAGRRRAAELGDALAARRLAHVWTSTLARAVQTGEIVAARCGVGVTTRRALDEVDSGDLTGQTTDLAPYLEVYRAWQDGLLDARLPGGESGEEVATRVAGVLREIADAHPGETVLVVSHGGAIDLGVPRLCAVPARRDLLGDGGSVELVADADGWTCTRWG